MAERIRKLMTEQKVTDKATGELRAVRYSDIVILLRSLSGYADSFAAVLNEAGIPAHTVSATGYFSAVEVQTVLAMLRILDNPRQDIPLAAVLKSPIAGLTDEELGRLRAHDRSVPFCECVLARCRELAQSEEPLAEGYEKKLWEFWKLYERLRALGAGHPDSRADRDRVEGKRLRKLCGGDAGRSQTQSESAHAGGEGDRL